MIIWIFGIANTSRGIRWIWAQKEIFWRNGRKQHVNMSFLLELASMPITPGPGMNLHSVMTGKVRKPVFLMMESWLRRMVKENGGKGMTPRIYMHRIIRWVKAAGAMVWSISNGHGERVFVCLLRNIVRISMTVPWMLSTGIIRIWFILMWLYFLFILSVMRDWRLPRISIIIIWRIIKVSWKLWCSLRYWMNNNVKL